MTASGGMTAPVASCIERRARLGARGVPAAAIDREMTSGGTSILTPSAVSTSEAPESDDTARLPCLATGTPAPETMKAAQVETLTEPEPSPPVPTTSIASAGAFTRSILLRIADTAPVISSTVSPRW